MKYEESIILREGPLSFQKKLRRVIVAVVLLLVLLAAAAVFLPGHYKVERSVTIPAKAPGIFADINNLRKWPEWVAWTTNRYPEMKVEFAGPPSGVGATYKWSGKSSGQGSLRITKSTRDQSVAYDLSFENGKYLSTGTITLEPRKDGTLVTWVNEGDLNRDPVSRYFGQFMDKMMGPDFEAGLENLRRRHTPPGK
ncbi:MAG TPA: SRPBCC family protein [Verrucomicrobiae bacterium]|nr:SRPBCC family protein [Verrucomicrobiae bacterium]